MLSLSSTRVGDPGEFVGLKNFDKIWNDSIFRTTVWNTFWYTGVTTVFKLALGLWLAMLLNRHFKGKAIIRAFILLPFIIPTVLSTFAWKWMFDPTFSVINWTLFQLGFITTRINWLGDPDLAMTSIIVVNIWRGVPFFAITPAGRPADHQPRAARGRRHRRRAPVAALLARHLAAALPVTLVVVLFSVIQTFADFQLVYVMTGGGPANATHLFATYAYQLGIGTGLLSEGAAISLAMFPFLFIIVVVQLLYIRRVETR